MSAGKALAVAIGSLLLSVALSITTYRNDLLAAVLVAIAGLFFIYAAKLHWWTVDETRPSLKRDLRFSASLSQCLYDPPGNWPNGKPTLLLFTVQVRPLTNLSQIHNMSLDFTLHIPVKDSPKPGITQYSMMEESWRMWKPSHSSYPILNDRTVITQPFQLEHQHSVDGDIVFLLVPDFFSESTGLPLRNEQLLDIGNDYTEIEIRDHISDERIRIKVPG